MMKKVLLAIVAGVLLAPLAAGARDRGFYPWAQAAPGEQWKKGPPGQFPRGDRREKEGRPPRDERQQGGRMTDEERRELHRDLDRANREIYRPKGRW